MGKKAKGNDFQMTNVPEIELRSKQTKKMMSLFTGMGKVVLSFANLCKDRD